MRTSTQLPLPIPSTARRPIRGDAITPVAAPIRTGASAVPCIGAAGWACTACNRSAAPQPPAPSATKTAAPTDTSRSHRRRRPRPAGGTESASRAPRLRSFSTTSPPRGAAGSRPAPRLAEATARPEAAVVRRAAATALPRCAVVLPPAASRSSGPPEQGSRPQPRERLPPARGVVRTRRDRVHIRASRRREALRPAGQVLRVGGHGSEAVPTCASEMFPRRPRSRRQRSPSHRTRR